MEDKMRKKIKKAKRIVIKVGTRTLTHENGKMNLEVVENLIRSMSDLCNQGKEVIFVSSGSIGVGMNKLSLCQKPKTIPEKQAAASVGQGVLLHIYEKIFAEYGYSVGQVLLTRDDMSERGRYLNARNTLLTLLNYKAVPIVNENDTVAWDEIKFGDNDNLAALVACLVDADLLIILSDIDGLYDANPQEKKDAEFVSLVTEIDADVEALAGDAISMTGTGGMVTKLEAAKKVMNSGIPMVIALGREKNIINAVLRGEKKGTVFLPKDDKLKHRQRWIVYGSKISGQIKVDDGAVKVICGQGRSLLPIGIIDFKGDFEVGDVISICDKRGMEIARGITHYNHMDLKKIMGHKTREISEILGFKQYDAVIHRNNMVVKKKADV